jgi:hypothetical protein
MLDAAGHTIGFGQDTTAVTASNVITVNVYGGAAQVNSASGNTFLPLPQGVVIPPGGQFQFNAAGIDAGDQWSGVTLTFAGSQTEMGTPFSLQLGDRNWQLVLPNTGIMTERFNPGLLLKQSDQKVLNSAVAGNWAVELTGYRSVQ